jgi:hypothetical protein
LHSTKRDTKTSGFFSHRFQTAIVRERASADENRIAGFTMKNRIGLSAPAERKQQYQDQEKGLPHKPPTLNSVGDRLSIGCHAIDWIAGKMLSDFLF